MTVDRKHNKLIVNVPYSTYGESLILDLKENPLQSSIVSKTVLTNDGFQISIDIPNKKKVKMDELSEQQDNNIEE
jgi:hypothetical protein